MRIEGADHTGFQQSDLEFLKYFRHLRRFSLEQGRFGSLEGLRQLSPDTIRLELDLRDSKPAPSLEPLAHFRSLQSLTLAGHYEDLSRFSNLSSLRALELFSVPIKDISSLVGLEKLQSLSISESKIKSISGIFEVGRLQYLGLDRLPQIAELEEISKLSDLEFLSISSLSKVESMPSLKALDKLRRVSLVGLKNLKDLAPISEAPNLEQLWIHSMGHLKPKDLECFVGHPKLQFFRTDDEELKRALGLPGLGTGNVFEFSCLPPVERKARRATPPAVPGRVVAERVVDDLAMDDEEKIEELRVYIKLDDEFPSDADHVAYGKLEDQLEELLSKDLLGRWDGHECGGGYFLIFYVGNDAAAMFKQLKGELRKALPPGSYVELEGEDGKVVTKRFK